MVKTYPRITIVTPTLNQGKFIERTIRSVIEQNYPNLQYIIIDGGSTDETLSIIRKYESFINYWVSEKDNGQSEAINKGIAKMDGEIFNWLNSDDVLTPNALNKIAEAYQLDKDCNLVIGQVKFFTKEDSYGLNGKVVFSEAEQTFALGQVNQPAMYYKADVLKKIGNLNENLHYCMDVELWLRYILNYGIGNIRQLNEIVAEFLFHPDSKTVSKPQNFEKERHAIYNGIFNHYLGKRQESVMVNLPVLPLINMNEALNYYQLWQSDVLALKGEKDKALRNWIKVNPFRLNKAELRRYFAVIKNIMIKK